MKKLAFSFMLLLSLFTNAVFAAPDLDLNTPAIAAIKNSMQTRHTQLAPHYASGAIGLTGNGLIAVRDATALPLKDRSGINGLVAAENADRTALYSEIAKGNGHPEWEGQIRSTFAGRWVDRAPAGWYFQNSTGWVKK